jgi:valyl-tRNA synthetase
MQGYNALWIPGTDHAAISTEVKVTNQLKEEGIDKKELGREKFLERTWQWKEEYAGTIEGQLKKLGVSCDWDRERFTMDEGCSKAVEEVFIKLYNEGYIYKGSRIINWCPICKKLNMRSRTDSSGILSIQSLEQMTIWRSQRHVRRHCLEILRSQFIRMMKDTKTS